MPDTIVARATSLAASAALLSLATIAALSFSYTVMNPSALEATPTISIEPETPPPPALQTPPPMQPVAPLDVGPLAITPLAPVLTEGLAGLTSWSVEPAGPATIENPRWLQRPSDLARYYPSRALERGMEGEAVLDCLVGTSGALSCTVVTESPMNWGFGAAAIRIAEDHRMVPATRNGQAVEGRYRMRVPFEMN